MEARAPYHTPTPKPPRNLATPLAQWLREHGFVATEQHHGTALVAHWTGSRGEHFQLTYDWVAGASPDATCRLQVYQPGEAHYEVLFTAQRVRRLRDACRLLLGNVRYANARTLATLPQPAL